MLLIGSIRFQKSIRMGRRTIIIRMKLRGIFMKSSVLIILLASLMACQSTPTLQSGPDAEYSYDGLVKVDNSLLDTSWVRPGIDLTGYDKIMLFGAGVKYRSVREVSRVGIRNASEFPIDQAGRAAIEQSFGQFFVRELISSDRFEYANEAGPNTLALTAGIIDLVSFVPPDTGFNEDFYLTELGEATLVLEISDSVSGQIFGRTTDTRRFDTSTMIRSQPVTNRAEFANELERWGESIREALEYFADNPYVEAAAEE